MPSEKRERQRNNRAQRHKVDARKARWKSGQRLGKRVAIYVVIGVLGFILFQVAFGENSTTTTTVPETTSTTQSLGPSTRSATGLF